MTVRTSLEGNVILYRFLNRPQISSVADRLSEASPRKNALEIKCIHQ